jgi:hypothetical protein
MPISFVSIARLRDHLILTSTLDEEQSLASIKAEAKKFYRTLSRSSQPRITYRLSSATLHICVSNPIFAFCASDNDFDPQLAYQMLDQAIAAFNSEYAGAIESVEQEHVFIDFYSTLDAIRARFVRQVADVQLSRVRRELSGVQESMASNIKTALIREEKLTEVGDLSESLGSKATAFEKDATNLNRLHFWRTYGRPAVVLSIVSLVYFLVGLLIV